MSEHTPAPWHSEKRTVLGRGSDSDHYLIRHGATEIAIARHESDTRLITAAPYMYAELQRLHGLIAEFEGDEYVDWSECLVRITDLLANHGLRVRP